MGNMNNRLWEMGNRFINMNKKKKGPNEGFLFVQINNGYLKKKTVKLLISFYQFVLCSKVVWSPFKVSLDLCVM